MTLYGLTKCGTCDKAKNWLLRHKIEYTFIDYREHPIAAATLKQWAVLLGGWEKLVNRSSMTWRNLPLARKEPASDPEWTLLIKEYPALIRRPVTLAADGSVSVGFSDKQYALRFASK